MNTALEIAFITSRALVAEEVFKPGGLDSILSEISERARSEVPDTSSAKGRAAVASLAHRVARSKTALDEAGKNLVAQWKNQSAAVDAERRRARDYLDSLRDDVRAPLTDWEQEQERIEQEKAAAKALAEKIEREAIEAAERAKRDEIEQRLRDAENALRAAEQALLAEREAKEAAQRRAQEAVEAEGRAERERAAEQQRMLDATALAERLEQLAAEAEERANLRLARAAEDAAALAERRVLDAVENERRRNEEIERRRLAEEAGRAADRDLRQKIHAEIRDDLLASITGHKTRADIVGAIVDALVARHIRHVTIAY